MKFVGDVSPGSIWDDHDTYFQEKETLIISMFHINPVIPRDEIKSELQRVFKDIEARFRPWINHYIWNESPVKFEMVEYDDVDYIFGQMEFGDYYDDEWLVTQILFDLSKTYEDLYIHLSDTEGSYLLIEGAEYLPDWIEPENARNRDWINHGRILIIPEEYYKDRGLKLKESLRFLDRAVYKCLKIEEIDKTIMKKLKQFPTKALEGQIEIEITIPRALAGVLMKSNILNQAVIANAKEISSGKPQRIEGNDLVDLKIRTTALAYLFIDYFSKSQNEPQKVAGGKLVTESLKVYLKENTGLEKEYIPTDSEIEQYNDRGDVLQNELIRLMRIDKRVEPNISFDNTTNDEKLDGGDNEMISKLEDFFKDTNAGFEGVDNKTEELHRRTPGSKIEELDDSDDTDDEDDKARAYLVEEKVSIDEDDFFEFFTKEALKLSDEDLETFRNMNLDDNDVPDDYEPDSDEEELFKKFTSGDTGSSLQELLKSIEGEGGASGPAATLLQSMGINIPPGT